MLVGSIPIAFGKTIVAIHIKILIKIKFFTTIGMLFIKEFLLFNIFFENFFENFVAKLVKKWQNICFLADFIEKTQKYNFFLQNCLAVI